MAQNGKKTGLFARRRWVLWALGLIVAVILFASFASRDDSVPIVATAVSRSTIRSVISTNGKVEPVQNFEAHAPIGTTVKKILVKEGDHVKKGTLLVELNAASVQSQAAQAMTRLQQSGAASPGEVRAAQNQLTAAEAQVKLLESKQTERYSRPEVSRVQAEQSQAESAYHAAEHVLSQLVIRAPFNGVVYSLPVRQGAYVNP